MNKPDKPKPNDFRMPGVREYQYQDMRAYTRDCADIMGLRDWTICYAFSAPPLSEIRYQLGEGQTAELGASMETHPTARSCTLWLPPGWYKLAAGDHEEKIEARATVAHEFLHVHFERLRRITDHVETNLGEVAWRTWSGMYNDEEEKIVELLDEICAHALPMPDMPTKPPLQRKRRGLAATFDPAGV